MDSNTECVFTFGLVSFWIPTIVSIIAVILTYVDMRRRLKQEQDALKFMLELINVMREELRLFREQVGKSRLTSQELERQKLLQREQEQKWRQAKDVFKAIRWLADTGNSEDVEEDWCLFILVGISDHQLRQNNLNGLSFKHCL